MDKFIKLGEDAWGAGFGDPYHVVRSSSGLIKTASDEQFHPRIKKYLCETSFTNNDIVLVVVPLGSYETWDSNVNGDAFERCWLEPENPDWGHRSFENHARAYQHHQNKVPDRGFGTVPVSAYDPLMNRVEAVFRIDRAKANKVGAGWVPDKLDSGKMIDLSMGARVKYDVCSICKHEARSTSEYCGHLRNQMNQILPDGRLICAYNPKPRFFDLSFVYVRAAKEAAILQKFAQAGFHIGRGDSQSMTQLLSSYDPDSGWKKVAATSSNPKLAGVKLAELEKRFPAVFSKIVRPLYKTEEPIPDQKLQGLSTFPFPEILASTAARGIVLRPREFQYLFLRRNGEGDMADKLHSRRVVFQCAPGRDSAENSGRYILSPDHIRDRILQLLSDMVPKRSVLQPFISKRIVVTISFKPEVTHPPTQPVMHPLLDGVAGEYAKYINSMARLPSFLKSAMDRRGDVFDVFTAASYDPLEKVSSFKSEVMVPAMALILPTYLLSSKWGSDQRAGEDLHLVQDFVADHPMLASLGLITGYHGLGLNRSIR